MPDKRIALVTGANQGVGRQVAKELVANGLTVLVGSRNFEHGEAAATEIGSSAIPLQLDVTDLVSIATAALLRGFLVMVVARMALNRRVETIQYRGGSTRLPRSGRSRNISF
jgi:NADP-dependent 3-hydroxy acid dehydrogenase YdfG